LIGAFHPRVGGGETHARLLARELNALGVPTFVLTRRHERRLPPRDTVDGVPVRRIGPPGFPRLGKYLMIPGAVAALIRLRAEYDIIYVCAFRVLGVAGALAARLAQKRLVLRAEACGEWSGAFIRGGRLPFLLRALLTLRNRLLRGADRFVAISSVAREEFRAGGIPERQIACIPNGVDFTPFSPPDDVARARLRTAFGLGDRFVFAYSGKLNRGKGLELLLRVWKRVVPEYPRAHVLLIGGGGGQFLSCENELRAFVADNGLTDSVTFTGYTDRVADYLRAADAFVFPSESESLPLALIEAMGCGLPALASNVGGIPDIITDREDGRLIPPYDEDAWQAAIIDLMKNPAAASRWGRNAAASVRRKFSIREIAVQHRALFEAILET
jgi:glycosyltransferase involved in cell wall biosynthesis